MKKLLKRFMTILMSLTLVMGLIAVPGKAAWASTSDDSDDSELNALKVAIETFSDDPFAGSFQAKVNKEDRTVTVTGDVYLIKKTLNLNIPHGVKVIWKARLVGNAAYTEDVIRLNGEGAFELAEDGELGVGWVLGEESEISEFCAIKAGEDFSEITVSGGQITITSGNAIQTTGQKTSVTITGGILNCYEGATIYTRSSDTLVKVSGGFVSSTYGATIQSSGKVLIDGGIVRSMKGTCVDSTGNVTITGNGQVIAYGGYGVKIETRAAGLDISGGLLFGYMDMNDNNIGPYLLFNISEGRNGSIVAWNKINGKLAFNAGTSENIYVSRKSDGTAKWAKDGNTSGIRVNNGTNTYFVMVPEVTVIAEEATVNSVTIKTPPTKTTYQVGEALDLRGLVVTLNKSDNTTEDVPFENFTQKGITTNPANGRTLITETSVVIITYTADNQSVNQRLTITPASINRTVTFNDGGLDSTSILVCDGSSMGELWPEEPSKEGYTFGGWYTGENGSGSAFTSGTAVNADITVYAKWIAVTGSNPGNGNSNSGTTNGTEQVTVDVKQGNSDSVASKITIERTTNADGTKSDKVTYQKDKAAETVQKLKDEGKDTARIVIPDEKDEVSETKVNIPAASLATLADGKINLQIDTEEAKISLSKESVLSASQSLTDDLYFRLVPVKNETEKETVSNQARLNAVKVSGNVNATASIIGNPVTIETNMPSTQTDITLPLTGVVIPTNSTEKEAFLKQLAVYIEHSDGDKELVKGELVEYKDGTYGIRFHINKFSTFTVVKTNAFTDSSMKEISGITIPENAIIKGNIITASVANEVSSLTVKAAVSNNASWKLYLDKDLKKEVSNKKLTLTTGVNTSYIKVTAKDGTSKIYKLTIIRGKSTKADVTKVIVPEKAVINGNTITAAVASEKSVVTVNAQVSSKASTKLYSDKTLKKEIKNRQVSLKRGINTVYLKVTAENGTSKVYILNIIRKAEVYKSHINLGLIGSKDYANKVAKIFEQDYDSANVKVTSKGSYYLVTMDFKNKAAARKACEDMKRREYIINYYYN